MKSWSNDDYVRQQQALLKVNNPNAPVRKDKDSNIQFAYVWECSTKENTACRKWNVIMAALRAYERAWKVAPTNRIRHIINNGGENQKAQITLM